MAQRRGRTAWKKGRGKLGALEPLLGTWEAKVESARGAVRCLRRIERVLGGTWLQLDARWELPAKVYEERALIGLDPDGAIVFHSFTSDGKRSVGRLADGRDVHAEAITFVADMPAGPARMIYWPGEGGTMNWAVESKTKTGWRRFTQHLYVRR